MSKARDLADFISDSTIETAELADNAVTSAKLDETDSYTVAGLTATGDIVMGDDNKVTFGENPDFTIYHDSANLLNRIDANNLTMMVDTGNFRVRGDDETNMINAVRGAAVTLYHNNSPKFATTSTGIDVTGTAVTDGLTVAGNVSVDGGTIKLDGNYPVGTGNVALGDGALNGSLTGNYNSVLGERAAISITSGERNIAVGYTSLNLTTTGVRNVAVGMSALQQNTSGGYNIGIGYQALAFNETASNNTAVGYQSLYANTTGFDNVAVGRTSSDAITTGAQNTSLGGNSLTTLVTGNNNTAVGFNALFNATGSWNTAIGKDSGQSITTGEKNVILGSYNGNQDGLDIRTASNRIVVSDGDGNIGMYIDGSQDAHFDGDVIAYSTTISDRRLKDDIENITDALDKVGQINGVTFVRKNNGQASAGVVAQEIMEVLPEAVKEKSMPIQTGTEDIYYVVEYDAVTGLLVEAVKELKARVEALEAK